MRIGALMDLEQPMAALVEQVQGFAEQNLASAWATQIFGYDALTALAAVGAQVPGIELGTGVVPVYSRLPQVMAQQALTVQAATGGRLALGIGMSHQVVVEGMWGLSYDHPARYLREYLAALLPMLAGEAVQAEGEVVTARTVSPLAVAGTPAPAVLVAALGPVLLGIAGRATDGTVTWMTGIRTIGEHVAPTIGEAARAAGRPAPRVVVALPVTVTGEPDRARERIDRAFAIYPTLPSYRAMLDREGAERPSDIALVGTDGEVAAAVAALAGAGATDLVASIVGDDEERARTTALLSSLASAG
ncbi:MAG: TIGR03564 family F420-dependent LLM class oxidoreductase [Acidimicrobiales bacterium]